MFSVIAAIGLGFLINDAILIPLLVLSLTVTLWGLFSGWRRHRRPWALALAVVASAALGVFGFAHTSRPLALASIGLSWEPAF